MCESDGARNARSARHRGQLLGLLCVVLSSPAVHAIFTVDHASIARRLDAATPHIRQAEGLAAAQNYVAAVEQWHQAIRLLEADDDDYHYGKLYLIKSKLLSAIGWARLLDRDYPAAGSAYESAIHTIKRGYDRHRQKLADNAQRYEMFTNLLTIGATTYAQVQATRAASYSGTTPPYMQPPQWVDIPEPELALPGVTIYPSSLQHNVYRIPIVPDHGALKRIGRVHNGTSHCTGSLVGRRLVLTNAHCVTNSERGQGYAPHELEFRLEKVRYTVTLAVEHYVTEMGLDRASPALYGGEGEGTFATDWAILIVELPAGFELGYLAVEPGLNNDNRFVHDGNIVIPGYSGDLNDGDFITADVGCSITRVAPDGQLQHDCDGAPGSSGTPILSMVNNAWAVVGLHACGRRARSPEDRVAEYGCGLTIDRVVPTIEQLRQSHP